MKRNVKTRMRLLAKLIHASFNKYAENAPAAPAVPNTLSGILSRVQSTYAPVLDPLAPALEKGRELYQGARSLYQKYIKPLYTPELEKFLIRAGSEYGNPAVIDGIAALGGRLFTSKEALKKAVSDSTTGTFTDIVPAFKIMQEIFETTRSLKNDMTVYGISEQVHKKYLDQLTSQITKAKEILSSDYNMSTMSLRPTDQITHQLLQTSFKQLDALQELVKRDYGKKIGAKMELTEDVKKDLKAVADYYKALSDDAEYVSRLTAEDKQALLDSVASSQKLYDDYEQVTALRMADMPKLVNQVKAMMEDQQGWERSYTTYTDARPEIRRQTRELEMDEQDVPTFNDQLIYYQEMADEMQKITNDEAFMNSLSDEDKGKYKKSLEIYTSNIGRLSDFNDPTQMTNARDDQSFNKNLEIFRSEKDKYEDYLKSKNRPPAPPPGQVPPLPAP